MKTSPVEGLTRKRSVPLTRYSTSPCMPGSSSVAIIPAYTTSPTDWDSETEKEYVDCLKAGECSLEKEYMRLTCISVDLRGWPPSDTKSITT